MIIFTVNEFIFVAMGAMGLVMAGYGLGLIVGGMANE